MTIRRGAAFALALPISAAVFLPAGRAAASDSYWEGAEATGVLIAGGECPIVLEKETLSIDIPELPSLFTAESFSAYRPNVTVKYLLRNPTETDYTATLFFPFGETPAYAPWGYDFYGDSISRTVTENGEKVPVRSRYSYCTCGADYEAGSALLGGISLLAGSRETSFFRKDTPVTVHTLRIDTSEVRIEKSGKPWAMLEVDFKADASRTRIATSGEWASKCIEKGNGVIVYGFDPSKVADFTFNVYAFGEDVGTLNSAVYENRNSGKTLVGATVSDDKSEPMTYEEFVNARYPEGKLSREDWYNGFTAALEESLVCNVMYDRVPDKISACDFMRWYEYDLNIPAGESVENAITAPIYPSIRGDEYEYTYLLSPASKWASFGDLSIDIETPYVLTESSLDFRKREGGYTLSWENGLPLGELTFTLAESESSGVAYTPFDGETPTTVLVAVLVSVAAVVTGIVLTVYFVMHRRKAAARGETKEGKVDLPPREKK